MQATNKSIDLQLIKNDCESRIDSFFSQFGIVTIVRNLSSKKARGYSALSILLKIFILSFIGKIICRSTIINPKSDIWEYAICEFIRSNNFCWRRLLLKLAFGVHEFIDELINKDRESVLILALNRAIRASKMLGSVDPVRVGEFTECHQLGVKS